MRSTKRGKQGPEDLNEIAFRITEQAVGEDSSDEVSNESHGQVGGLKGGPARAAKLSAERRSEIARKAAQERWRRAKEK